MNRTHEDATLRAQTQQAALFELLKSGTATAGTAEAFRKITLIPAGIVSMMDAAIWHEGRWMDATPPGIH